MSTAVPPPRLQPRPRASAGRRLVAVVLLLATALVAAGCAKDEPSADDVSGLVILSGDVGEAHLAMHTGADGQARSIEPPAPSTSWISTAPDGRLLATLADGSLAIGDAAGDGAWRAIKVGDEPTASSLLFATASPDGKLAAALTLAAAGQFGIAIVDLENGDVATFPVEGEPILTSPTWLDGERVGIAAVDEATGGAVAVADVSSGEILGGPGNVRAVAMSADGSVVSWIAADDGLLYATNARTWLSGADDESAPIEGPGDSRPGSFALDATGGRLAVVWERDDGTVARIEVLRRTSDGWTLMGRLDPPAGDPRAVVSWLR